MSARKAFFGGQPVHVRLHPRLTWTPAVYIGPAWRIDGSAYKGWHVVNAEDPARGAPFSDIAVVTSARIRELRDEHGLVHAPSVDRRVHQRCVTCGHRTHIIAERCEKCGGRLCMVTPAVPAAERRGTR